MVKTVHFEAFDLPEALKRLSQGRDVCKIGHDKHEILTCSRAENGRVTSEIVAYQWNEDLGRWVGGYRWGDVETKGGFLCAEWSRYVLGNSVMSREYADVDWCEWREWSSDGVIGWGRTARLAVA